MSGTKRAAEGTGNTKTLRHMNEIIHMRQSRFAGNRSFTHERFERTTTLGSWPLYFRLFSSLPLPKTLGEPSLLRPRRLLAPNMPRFIFLSSLPRFLLGPPFRLARGRIFIQRSTWIYCMRVRSEARDFSRPLKLMLLHPIRIGWMHFPWRRWGNGYRYCALAALCLPIAITGILVRENCTWLRRLLQLANYRFTNTIDIVYTWLIRVCTYLIQKGHILWCENLTATWYNSIVVVSFSKW